MASRSLVAAIFDMDGLLTASEARWRIAEREQARVMNLPFTDADFDLTAGVRMRDVARQWFAWHPWPTPPSTDEVAERVVNRVIELTAGAEALPGVYDALDFLERRGLRLALCSSSDQQLIDATLAALNLGERFEVVHSAEFDRYGKPHPEPYLATAAKLGVAPSNCVVFEDAVSGCVAAKAAGMAVVAVPDPQFRGTAAFGFADVVLESLVQLGEPELVAMETGAPVPTLSRPRFELRIAADDLLAARDFYGVALGCAEVGSGADWVGFNLWGHHLIVQTAVGATPSTFGLVVPGAVAASLPAALRAAGLSVTVTEDDHGLTFAVTDPAGNTVRFRAIDDDRRAFA